LAIWQFANLPRNYSRPSLVEYFVIAALGFKESFPMKVAFFDLVASRAREDTVGNVVKPARRG
jgi:hypothetical protein